MVLSRHISSNETAHPLDAITEAAEMKTLIRYEYEPDNVWAIWEDENGNRTREHIVINGEVQW